ncbi:flavodoxin family protein [Clostridium lacusfryxellense]|uniref:flavodoxin family protein n=1 Tax=Clostridium lacusfryxellense TaxID=205328 RepID=UPI001C0CE82C|nr:flavodoxin domain-containing protein [Clostridium lacusfryxellense]MBU3112913.1 flavodoxin [Clostridium lacusfryxellense]
MNKAKIAVRYYTQSGNTEKLALRIADTAGIKASTIDKSIDEKVDILFIGASVYWGGIDKNMKKFIDSLSPNMVGKAVVFSTSAMKENAYAQMKDRLEAKGITVENNNFYCRGQFTLLHKNRPNAEDLNHVEEFAKKFLN